MTLAGQTQTFIYFLDIFHRESASQGHRHHELSGRSVHGIHIGEIHLRGFVAKMLQRCVNKVEVDALHEHIARHKHLFVGIRKHSAIIAYAFNGRSIFILELIRQMMNQPKLSQF